MRDTTVLFNAPFILVSLFVALGSVVYWITQKREAKFGFFFKAYLGSRDLLRYSSIFAVLLVLQIGLANSRGAWWVIPAIPAACFALAIGIVPLLARLPRASRGGRVAQFSLVACAAIALFFTASASNDVVGEVNASRSDSILAAEKQLRDRPNSAIVYDWSIGWRKPPYGGQCGALVFAVGPEFGEAVKSRCPDTWLANFSYPEILPFGVNWKGCDDIADRLAKSTEIYLLKPALESTHPNLEATFIEGNADWELYEITTISCASSK